VKAAGDADVVGFAFGVDW
jgi:hypothetical protein